EVRILPIESLAVGSAPQFLDLQFDDAANVGCALARPGPSPGPIWVTVAGAIASSTGLALGWSRDDAWLVLLPTTIRGSGVAVWRVGEQVVHPVPGRQDAWCVATV